MRRTENVWRRWPYWLIGVVCVLEITKPLPASAMSCNLLAASRFNFGAYDPLSPLPLDVQATYTLQCVPDHRQERLNLRIMALSAGSQSNELLGSSTEKSVRFGMFSDPQRSVPIDARPLIELSDRISTPQDYPITIYGRLPARQNITAGVYRASIHLVIEY